MEQGMRQLPSYDCHKRVWALKIKAIEIVRPTIEELEVMLDGGEEKPAAFITPEEEGYAPFGVSNEYLRKHNPVVGGYWVQYKDGYQSFSPAEAFEGGYTLVR